MGCHTWFYKKVNPQPTREDKVSQFIERTRERVCRLEKALSNNGFGWDNKEPWFPYNSRDSVERMVDEYKWALDNADHYENYSDIKSAEDEIPSKEEKLYNSVENWLAPLDEDCWDFGIKNSKFDERTKCIDGIYYSRVDRYDDIFRYHNYGAYVLSEDEMRKLIDDNKIIVNDKAKKKLKEFWNLYPDGMIYFG